MEGGDKRNGGDGRVYRGRQRVREKRESCLPGVILHGFSSLTVWQLVLPFPPLSHFTGVYKSVYKVMHSNVPST
jgi:hypothetical protein